MAETTAPASTRRRERELYFSTDIEADGPAPGRNSMLSLGSTALRRDGTEISRFSANLCPLPGAVQDERTMREFWDKNPEAWAEATRDPRPAEIVMRDYAGWVRATCLVANPERPPTPVFAGYPASWDFLHVYWYLIVFTGECLFGNSALDMKTLAMALMKTNFKHSTKRNMPRRWFETQTRHNHVAVDDANNQGKLLAAMFRDLDTAG